MKLEVVIRPERPISRETVEGEVSSRLDHPDADADEIAGGLGRSSRCRACLQFVRCADGTTDRTRVESVDLRLEIEDARDGETVEDWCSRLASALGAPLRAPDGGHPLDSAGVTALIHGSKRAERRFRAVLAVVGLSALAAGGLCLSGVDGPGGLHHALSKIGLTLCVVGVMLVTVAVVGARASKPLGAKRRINAEED